VYVYQINLKNIGCVFLLLDRQAPAQSPANFASNAVCRGGLTVDDGS
jgi:hypothetical protein